MIKERTWDWITLRDEPLMTLEGIKEILKPEIHIRRLKSQKSPSQDKNGHQYSAPTAPKFLD